MRTLLIGLLIWLVPLVASGAPPAELLRALGVPASLGREDSWTYVQTDLAWIGLYSGQVTGARDAATAAAVRRFQQSINAAQTGTLTAADRAALRARAAATMRGYGFGRRMIDWLGIEVDLPNAVLHRPEVHGKDRNQVFYESYHAAGMRLKFTVWDWPDTSPALLLRAREKGLTDVEDPPTIVSSRAYSKQSFDDLSVGRHTRD